MFVAIREEAVVLNIEVEVRFFIYEPKIKRAMFLDCNRETGELITPAEEEYKWWSEANNAYLYNGLHEVRDDSTPTELTYTRVGNAKTFVDAYNLIKAYNLIN